MTATDERTTTLDKHAIEGGSYQIDITLKDTSDAPATITEANVKTATLTLVDENTKTVINSHTATDIKNANNCEIVSDELQLMLLPADNALVGSDTEWHVAIITMTYDKTINSVATEITLIHNVRFTVEKDKKA